MEMNGRDITSMIWITPEILAVGSNRNELIMYEGNSMKNKFQADCIDVVDLDMEGYVYFRAFYIEMYISSFFL